MKSGFDLLVSILALPDAEQEALFNCWSKLKRSSLRADTPKVAAKTLEVKAGSLHGKRFLHEELQAIRNAIAAGLTQAETARKVRKQFGNARAIGSYEYKVWHIANKSK